MAFWILELMAALLWAVAFGALLCKLPKTAAMLVP